MDYSGDAESWEQIRNDAENNKIPNVFIGSKEFVNVVRCRDCKWWTKQKDSLQGLCELNRTYPTGTWYCANGERNEQKRTVD